MAQITLKQSSVPYKNISQRVFQNCTLLKAKVGVEGRFVEHLVYKIHIVSDKDSFGTFNTFWDHGGGHNPVKLPPNLGYPPGPNHKNNFQMALLVTR